MGFFGFLGKNERKQKSIQRKPKIALCLGGGGARGFAHLGALKVFEEEGCNFDMCVGTSVGSLVGAFYCAGLSAEQMISYSHEIDVKDVRTGKLFFPSDPMAIGELFTRRMGNMHIEDMVKHGFTQARAGRRGGTDAGGTDPRQQNGGRGPQARSSSSLGIQPTVFTSPRKTVSGRLDPPRVALFGPGVVGQVRLIRDPGRVALGAWLHPGPGREEGRDRRGGN